MDGKSRKCYYHTRNNPEKLSVLIRPFNDINLVGCGRTDKGVHAEQFFSCRFSR